MASFTVETLSREVAEELNQVKERQDLLEYKHDSLIDLLTWMDYVYEEYLKI